MHQATTSTHTSLSQVHSEDTFNREDSLENIALGLKLPLLAWNCTMTRQEHPPRSSSPNKPQVCPGRSHPITRSCNPRSCRGCSKDSLFPSPAVWVRACGNSYFMGLLQLRFLRSFKEITQRNHQQTLSMERARGSPGAAAGAASGMCTHGEHRWERGGHHYHCSDPAPPFPRGVGRAEQMAGRRRAARSRRGALQPHHMGWARGQNQQAELSKYLQPFPGQQWGLHREGN